jgi:hypothetical protein
MERVLVKLTEAEAALVAELAREGKRTKTSVVSELVSRALAELRQARRAEAA